MAQLQIVADSPVPSTLRVEGTLPLPPRAVVFRKKVRVAIVLAAVACLAVAALVAFLTRREGERLERLRDHGVVTQAVVERKWKSGGKSKTRYVSYSFEHAGQRFTDDSSLSSRRWDEIAPGQSIRITFDPDDPSDTEVGNVTQGTIDAHWRMVLLAGGAVGLIVLAFLLFAWASVRRLRALLRDGELVSATIESIGPASRKGRRCKVVFVVAGDASASGPHRHSIAQRLLHGLAAGDAVAWLTLRDAPKRGAPLAICLESCQLDDA